MRGINCKPGSAGARAVYNFNHYYDNHKEGRHFPFMGQGIRQEEEEGFPYISIVPQAKTKCCNLLNKIRALSFVPDRDLKENLD